MSVVRAMVLAFLLWPAAAAVSQAHEVRGSGATAAVRLFDNLGSYHHPVTTAAAEAQRYFDQGLTLVYAFNHDEARRSFEEAARLDPGCAMAWWGVALALGPNINLPIDPEQNRAAYEAVQRALSLADRVSEPEAAYTRALAVRYSLAPDADRGALDAAYAKAMGEVHRRYPDDPDAAVLYAESLMDLKPWHWWSLDGTPAERTAEIVDVLESVLRREPQHVGANHYYVHTLEASPHPERALPSARRLETLVPGAGHLVHMPSHIYMRVGDYDAAVKSNEAAVAADRAYVSATGAEGVYPALYLSHNLHFLAIAAGMAGESAKALNAATDLGRLMGPVAAADASLGDYFFTALYFIPLRFARWDAALRFPEPPTQLKTATAARHAARGLAFAAKGDLESAEQEQRSFETAVAAIPAETMLNLSPARDVLGVARAVLEARVAEAKGDRAAAVGAWRRAVALQDTLAYDEPPIWYYPVRESLGGALLRAGHPKEAQAVFRADLERNPRNGRSLFGLWKSLEAERRPTEAWWVQREFDEAWKNADVRLTQNDL